MATALASLFVEISARTDKFDRGIAASRTQLNGLSATMARARDANGRFVTGMGQAAARAGTYVDAAGRMRTANGRFVAGMGGVTSSVGSAGSALGSFGGIVSRGASILGGTFTGALRGARSALGGIVSGATAVGGAIGSLGRRMKLPALFAGAVGAGAAGFAIKAAGDLEQKFSLLRKTTGLEGKDLLKLQGDLKGLATTMSGVSFDDLLGIASMGGRMGITGAQLNQFTRDIAMVSIALDDIPAEESATSIARTLNVFKLGSENAIRFASALNKLDDSSTATGRDILDITARIAPTASTLGLSPQKVLAIATALKDAGAENEVAGSAMSQVFGLMAKKMDAFAKVAGVSTAEFSKALRGDPMDALTLLIGNIQKMDKIDAFSAISTLGIDGVRATGTLLQLGTVMGKMGGFVETANSEWSSQASIFSEVAIQGQTTWAQLQKVGNVIQILSAEIGAFFLPVVKALAGSFGELGMQIRGLVDANSGSIKGFLDPLVTGARMVGLLFTDFSSILALGGVAAEEVGLKITTVLTRSFQAVGTYMMNLFKQVASFLVDLFSQIAARFGIELVNALPGPDTPVPAVRPNLTLFRDVNLMQGVDFGGIMKGLDTKTLDPRLAAEKEVLQMKLRDRRAEEDWKAKHPPEEKRDFRLLPDLPVGLRTGLGLDAGIPSVALALERAATSKAAEKRREKARRAAEKEARRAARGMTPEERARASRAAKAKMTPAQRRAMQLEAARKARLTPEQKAVKGQDLAAKMAAEKAKSRADQKATAERLAADMEKRARARRAAAAAQREKSPAVKALEKLTAETVKTNELLKKREVSRAS